ncbi:MAG: glutathione S-transferase family protein [Gammaproteobacteria bacterium]
MHTLYDYLPSGNGYKVRLTLSLLKQPFKFVDLDIMKGATRTESFLQKNPNGRIPTLEYAPGEFLFESNAILHYLAQDTDLLPDSRLHRAQVLQWLFFEQYSHEPFIAVSRFILMHGEPDAASKKRLESKRKGGLAALKLMDEHLSQHDYFVNNTFSIADIGLYAYTHVADEGGFDLGAYPAVTSWLQRVASRPGHCLITDTFA